MHKHIGLAVASVISLALGGLGAASAADIAIKGPVYKAAPVEVFSWTGFYVGGNAGDAWGRGAINGTQVAPPPFLPIDTAAISTAASTRLKPDGFSGGGQAGYNWQTGSAVFGVEADIEAFHLRTTRPEPSHSRASCPAV